MATSTIGNYMKGKWSSITADKTSHPNLIDTSLGVDSATLSNYIITVRYNEDKSLIVVSGHVAITDGDVKNQNVYLDIDLPSLGISAPSQPFEDCGMIKNGTSWSNAVYKDALKAFIASNHHMQIIKHNFADQVVDGVFVYRIFNTVIFGK